MFPFDNVIMSFQRKRIVRIERSGSLGPEAKQLLEEMGFGDLDLDDLNRRGGSSVLLPVGGSVFDDGPRVRKITRTVNTNSDGVRTVTTTTEEPDGRKHVETKTSKV